MNGVKINQNAGQVLVQVAILVGVLFAFLALALDVGHYYAERRRMQNAADAGALAGAREICFGSEEETVAISVATEYAIDRNHAQRADVTVQGGLTVNVVAGETMNTFFAGLLGIDTLDVEAEAAAMCSGADSAGGIWPLAFKYEPYRDVITCGQDFLVFAQKDPADIDCAPESCICVDDVTITETNDSSCDNLCNCGLLGPHMGSGDRGWLNLFDPTGLYEDLDECEPHNCGASELGCWLSHDHPGEIHVGDCIPGESGVDASVKADIESRISDTVNIILYDRECDQPGDPEPLGTCPGTPYRVAAFGCVQVLGWEHNYGIPKCGDIHDDCQSAKNLKVVWARRVCDDPTRDADDGDPYDLYCISPTGYGSGQPADEDEVRTVSLVK